MLSRREMIAGSLIGGLTLYLPKLVDEIWYKFIFLDNSKQYNTVRMSFGGIKYTGVLFECEDNKEQVAVPLIVDKNWQKSLEECREACLIDVNHDRIYSYVVFGADKVGIVCSERKLKFIS